MPSIITVIVTHLWHPWARRKSEQRWRRWCNPSWSEGQYRPLSNWKPVQRICREDSKCSRSGSERRPSSRKQVESTIAFDRRPTSVKRRCWPRLHLLPTDQQLVLTWNWWKHHGINFQEQQTTAFVGGCCCGEVAPPLHLPVVRIHLENPSLTFRFSRLQRWCEVHFLAEKLNCGNETPSEVITDWMIGLQSEDLGNTCISQGRNSGMEAGNRPLMALGIIWYFLSSSYSVFNQFHCQFHGLCFIFDLAFVSFAASNSSSGLRLVAVASLLRPLTSYYGLFQVFLRYLSLSSGLDLDLVALVVSEAAIALFPSP